MEEQIIAPLVTRCAQCNSADGTLLRCSRCRVLYYCNREHQAAHFSTHKAACAAVARARAAMEKEERTLRELPGDWALPADPFTNAVGQFWSLIDTRDYMRARFGYVAALQPIHSRESVAAQLEHVRDMLRLNRSDNLGLRGLAPALMLRLDLDQQCYDFADWWETAAHEDEDDWGPDETPCLTPSGADPFHSAAVFCRRYGSLANRVSVALLKIKLLVDVLGLARLRREHAARLPAELLGEIGRHLVRSPVVLAARPVLEADEHAERVALLNRQIRALHAAVCYSNPFFWPMLLRPGRHLRAQPDHYSMGSLEEAQLVLRHVYRAWKETAGALDAISVLQKGAAEE